MIHLLLELLLQKEHDQESHLLPCYESVCKSIKGEFIFIMLTAKNSLSQPRKFVFHFLSDKNLTNKGLVVDQKRGWE